MARLITEFLPSFPIVSLPSHKIEFYLVFFLQKESDFPLKPCQDSIKHCKKKLGKKTR